MAEAITVEPVVANYGDETVCPGCFEWVQLDPKYGWRNGQGYTCRPPNTTHGQHFETILIREVAD